MNLKPFADSPFQIRISFHLLIAKLEEQAALNNGMRSAMAREILHEIEPYPELREGITDTDQLVKHAALIKRLTADIFPEALTLNEIKAITVPFQDVLFNQTQRLQNILAAAGSAFDINIRDFTEHQVYVSTCCIILNEFYGTSFNFSRPWFYDIPDARGIMKHYRILYNADFMDLMPAPGAPEITAADIELLRDNYHDLDLWKKYFPKNSWILKGFAIVSLFDATVENAVSALKGTLLGATYSNNLKDNILDVFRSIYKIPDMDIGFTSFNDAENTFSIATFNPNLKSYLLPDNVEEECFDAFCVNSLVKVVEEKAYFAVSDVSAFLLESPGNMMAQRFLAQGINSLILAPVVKNGHLLGIIELVSCRVGELNSINANQLEIVMPYITDTIDRQYSYMQNQIQALIQNEYTTIHPSVYWKFKKEAVKFIKYRGLKKDYALKEVTFQDVYPLYGQIDIKGSSETRNYSVQLDLKDQLTALIPLVEQLRATSNDAGLEQNIRNLQELVMDVQTSLRADTEQFIQNYLEMQLHPILRDAGTDNAAIAMYFERADKNGDFHQHRRKYETTVALINEKMALLLDRAQAEAQAVFPHYYERFKTDGIEHNLYIGAAIAPSKKFDISYLYNLRLWQLQVLCEMELEHHFLKSSLPYPLDVTSLILAFSLPMSIRFRMDEKRFDVDGTYNARFEIVKKRIDKAFIKGTTDRLTAVGKITIVYSNHEEEAEYRNYIRFLQAKHLFDEEVEMLSIEDLQGVSGLKAMRVKILYNNSLPLRKFYSYAEMQQAAKNTVF
ncbi:GAF domain-containing protein [Mucilaginibacter sp. 14171R-50]|uniref:GAF domain-containing protein n=1 Tax=Mucilaginibacter sp. 14171R-50 TaxID=2703789 RepID=UPI00138D4183|nr:GAF domain-containing protein [Mucilaginibacter sp. 14171R-50]QHS56644.1 GAF domain-containing protein [Mucilaginibacter sp. 14171R-50]